MKKSKQYEGALSIQLKDDLAEYRKVVIQEQFELFVSLGLININCLSPRQSSIIDLRLGKSKTLEEVGKEFCVNKERIRQVEQKAIEKIKNSYIKI